MKIKSFTQIVLISVCIIGLAVLGVGCLSYQSFSGPSLPRNRIAVLELENAADSLRVTSIDGTVVDLYPGTSIQLLPGNHALSFFPKTESTYYSGTAITKSIWVEAGKTYVAHVKIIHLDTLRGVSAPLSERLYAHAHDVKWLVVITEK